MNNETKKQLLEELKEKFKQTKEKLGFKSTFEEVNEICYLEDAALSAGFVSEQFSRQMINRLVETYYSWVPPMHSWIMPPQYDLIYLKENKQITEQEREEMKDLIKQIMYLVRKNKSIAFNNLKGEGEFVDELVEFDKKIFHKTLYKFNKKFEDYWKSEIAKK